MTIQFPYPWTPKEMDDPIDLSFWNTPGEQIKGLTDRIGGTWTDTTRPSKPVDLAEHPIGWNRSRGYYEMYNGKRWVRFIVGDHDHSDSGAGAGTISHGVLTDKEVDDHPQYSKTDGTRPFAGTVGGVEPVADTDLATKIYVDEHTPKAHDLGGAEHNADNLADLNLKISDATLDDASEPRTPIAHDLGGAGHGADTLANLNLKVSNATLDDAGDSRTPSAHKDSHKSGGGDTFVSTDLLEAIVKRLQESGGQNLLMGAVAEGEFLQRSGTSLIGASAGGMDFFRAKSTSSISISNGATVYTPTLFTVPAGYAVNSNRFVVSGSMYRVNTTIMRLQFSMNAGSNWYDIHSADSPVFQDQNSTLKMVYNLFGRGHDSLKVFSGWADFWLSAKTEQHCYNATVSNWSWGNPILFRLMLRDTVSATRDCRWSMQCYVFDETT